MSSLILPSDLLQQLIRCRSVTPQDDNAQLLLKEWLEFLGFQVLQLDFNGTPNLYATKKKPGKKHLLLAGHSDVVPADNPEQWMYDPFAGVIDQGYIYGRGAQDMKGGLVCFIAALAKIADKESPSISLAITGDEEGPAINGTIKILEHMHNLGEKWDFALVGEPTCKQQLGDIVKIGRRGSLNGILNVKGISGHVAYQHLADNAAIKIVQALNILSDIKLDEGSQEFQPSNLEITQIMCGGEATNVIPGEAKAKFNIRFNNLWTIDKLKSYICESLPNYAEIEWLAGASESFLNIDEQLVAKLKESIFEITGVESKLDTGGGTSDARFIKNYCPVVEFGLCGNLMHKVDESVSISELEQLTSIYSNFFQKID